MNLINFKIILEIVLNKKLSLQIIQNSDLIKKKKILTLSFKTLITLVILVKNLFKKVKIKINNMI
jgi:hypothetical protein